MLRGVAAIAVVCFHLASTLTNEGEFTHIPVFYPGNGGVDLFFLISGFVIAWTTGNDWNRVGFWRIFLEKRLLRVVPLYWLLTAAKLFLVLSVPFLFRAPPPVAGDVVRSFLFLPVWDDQGRNALIITAGWTLCYEMMFYYVVTACLALRWRPIVTAGPGLIVLGVLGAFRTPQWGALASLIDPLLLEFVAGMAIAELTRRGTVQHGLAMSMLLLGLGAAGWVLSGLIPDGQASAWRVVVWGVPTALILYGAISIEPWLNPRKLWLPLLLGDASYSIYLTHVLILPLPARLANRLHLSALGEWAVFAGLLACGLACGLLVWRLVERTLIDRGLVALGDRLRRPSRVALARRPRELVLPSQADAGGRAEHPVRNSSST